MEEIKVIEKTFKVLADPILLLISKNVRRQILAFIIMFILWVTVFKWSFFTSFASALMLFAIVTLGRIRLEITETIVAIAIIFYLIGFVITIPLVVAVFAYMLYKILIIKYQKAIEKYAKMSPEEIAGVSKRPKSVTIIVGDEE